MSTINAVKKKEGTDIVFNIVLFLGLDDFCARNGFLFDGIFTLILGLMIYMQWPSSSAWAIGTLVGVSLIFSGVTRVLMSLAVRRAASVLSPPTQLAA